MRGIARRLRSSFGIGSARMTIRSQLGWYWRWLLNVLMMAGVAALVWWLVQQRGESGEALRQRIEATTEENRTLHTELDAARTRLAERDRQHQIEAAAQGELARSVAQLQEQNASLKEDLGFLRRVMSSGTTPEGISLSELKIERGARPNEYRYHMLLVQGGQRKQDFKGRLQLVAHVMQGPNPSALTIPASPADDATSAFQFRFYQKVEGRFTVPEGASLRSVEVRVLALPGGQVKLSRTVNLP